MLYQLSYTPIEKRWTREAESNRPLQFCRLLPGRLAIARLLLVPSATIRTGDPLPTRQPLWPTELRGQWSGGDGWERSNDPSVMSRTLFH